MRDYEKISEEKKLMNNLNNKVADLWALFDMQRNAAGIDICLIIRRSL